MTEEEKQQNAPVEEPETPEAGNSPDAPPAEAEPSSSGFTPSFPIVGIGASAGGVRALERFFGKMPPDCGMAFVVIQHLHQKHKSQMDALLARQTRMKIQVAEEGMVIQPNHIYLNRPGKDLLIRNGGFHLQEITKEDGTKVPIDVLFHSLALNLEQYAICVILSGAGADGTQGAKAVKGQGGLVVVQDPEEAEYPRMPESAIDAGLADLVLSLEEMPGELIRYTRHPFLNRSRESGPEQDQYDAADIDQKQIRKILSRIHSHTGHDFSQYKKNTIRRRIERRMALHHIRNYSDYLSLLRRDTEELERFFRDMTITVTQFFRDPDVYESLTENVLKPMMARREPSDDILRVWVAGCSTGEEAYSLAIVFMETMEALEKYFKIKIFASDIDTEAVRAARSGLYPKGIAADISRERLRRFFTRKDDHYQVDSKIRDMVVFADHNIIRDPPFSKMDLISCRNLLIYMETDLQRRVFPLFHYALRPGGCLLLGTSESPGDSSRFFVPVDKKQKLFRRKDVRPVYFPDVGGTTEIGENRSAPAKERGAGRAENPQDEDENARVLFREAILERHTRPSVLIDPDNRIHYFHGDVGRFLSFPKGAARFDLPEMTAGKLRYRLMQSLQNVREREEPLRLEKVFLQADNGDVLVADVVLTPLESRHKRDGRGWVLVEFDAENPANNPHAEKDSGEKDDPDALETKLRHMSQELQATIEELETSNEELKSANEELQANNEELQSANEELESAKEELQSSNEELETVNAELYSKNQELMKTEDDMENLFKAIQNGVILLDDDLRVQRFSQTVTEIFKLKDMDRGRKLSDISCNLDYPSLEAEARAVLDTLERKELKVEDNRGTDYLVRIAPYRSSLNVIEGVVMTFNNITEIRKAEQCIRDAQGFMDQVFDCLDEPVLLVNGAGDAARVNPAFCEMFGVSADAVLDHSLFRIMDSRLDIPDLRRFLSEEPPKTERFRGEVAGNDPGQGVIRICARSVSPGEDQPVMALLTFQEEG